MASTERSLLERVGRDGLGGLTMAEMAQGRLVEILTEKVNQLDPRNLTQEQLEGRVRFLIDLLRETLTRRYVDLSALAYARTLMSMDHFVRVKDHTPDTQWRGYEDDLATVEGLIKDHQMEFDKFKAWQLRQPSAS